MVRQTTDPILGPNQDDGGGTGSSSAAATTPATAGATESNEEGEGSRCSEEKWEASRERGTDGKKKKKSMFRGESRIRPVGGNGGDWRDAHKAYLPLMNEWKHTHNRRRLLGGG